MIIFENAFDKMQKSMSFYFFHDSGVKHGKQSKRAVFQLTPAAVA